jgi:hypothetical protein
MTGFPDEWGEEIRKPSAYSVHETLAQKSSSAKPKVKLKFRRYQNLTWHVYPLIDGCHLWQKTAEIKIDALAWHNAVQPTSSTW